MSSELFFVTVATTILPPVNLILISLFTAPLTIEDTLPQSRFMALVFTSAFPVIRITAEALMSAVADSPFLRPKILALSLVITAVLLADLQNNFSGNRAVNNVFDGTGKLIASTCFHDNLIAKMRDILWPSFVTEAQMYVY